MRSGASVSQLFAEMRLPVGALIGPAWVLFIQTPCAGACLQIRQCLLECSGGFVAVDVFAVDHLPLAFDHDPSDGKAVTGEYQCVEHGGGAVSGEHRVAVVEDDQIGRRSLFEAHVALAAAWAPPARARRNSSCPT